MEALKPSVMVTQVLDLPRMMLEDTPTFDQQVRRLCTLHEYSSIKRVFITGNGDSYHASMAAEMAFENIANIPCEPMSAQRFLDYGAEWMPVLAPQDTLVIGISASGKTKRVVQSLERAKQYGALTIALTGTPDSPVTRVSDRTLCVQVSDLGRSPGIRTYSASLLGLFLIAIQLGEAQGRLSQDEADLLRKELVNLAAVVDATIRACDKPAQKAAQMCSDAGTMIFLGSGPSCGTAIFSAAKVVEAASVFSVGQDLEEWWHVEKFALPANIPTFLIAPPGRSYWRAVDLAVTAKQLERRLIGILKETDDQIKPVCDLTLPVIGEVREEFSSLVYHVAADLFASYLAEKLGRMLFQSDNPAFRSLV